MNNAFAFAPVAHQITIYMVYNVLYIRLCVQSHKRKCDFVRECLRLAEFLLL